MIDHYALTQTIGLVLTQAYGPKTPWHEPDEQGHTGFERAQHESLATTGSALDENILESILRLGIFAYQRQTLTSADQSADHDTVTVPRQLFEHLYTAANYHQIMLNNRIASATSETDRLSDIAEREYHRLCMDAAHATAFRPEEG